MGVPDSVGQGSCRWNCPRHTGGYFEGIRETPGDLGIKVSALRFKIISSCSLVSAFTIAPPWSIST